MKGLTITTSIILSNLLPTLNSRILPNSCVGQEDGDTWLQLSTHHSTMVPVKQQCSNEYVMLDYSKDNNIENYFTTFLKWHYAVAGPANYDTVNWEQWFLPLNDVKDTDAKLLISPDCNSCDESFEGQVFDTKTTYWMNGVLNKLFWGIIGTECGADYDTYQCYNCLSCIDEAHSSSCNPTEYEVTETSYINAGLCPFAVVESTYTVAQQRRIAQNSHSVEITGFNFKPTIGMDGRYCVCYQPGSEDFITSYELTEEQEKVILKSEESEKKQKIESKNRIKHHEASDGEMDDKRNTNIVYLTNKDFHDGTYRLTESGTYILVEDIELEFNTDDNFWPRSDQVDQYPGAGEYRDPYHLGFFAGIAIETDYVTIDLNGFEMKMSLDFYYNQRWFSLIELGNSMFMPGQGPAFFGADFISVSNIEIKNGVLGRVSHFAIHGNSPTNVLINNLHIKDFVTHGIQLNGWSELVIDNVEIGPSSTIEYLRGEYGHGRLWLERLRAIRDDMEAEHRLEEHIQFAGRKPMTATDLVDEMEVQLDLAVTYAKNRANNMYDATTDYMEPNFYKTEILGDNEMALRWNKVKLQFIQESGLPASSSITGMFLNGEASSVFSYQIHTTRTSTNAKLSNIYIHDLQHDMYEVIRFTKYSELGQYYATPLNSDIPAEACFGTKERLAEFNEAVRGNGYYNGKSYEEYDYQGLIIPDILIALGTFSDDWEKLGFLLIDRVYEHCLEEWSKGESVAPNDWRFTCNQDIMGHAGKGLLGLRMDGIENAVLENIEIENLYERSILGSDSCGAYYYFVAGTGAHFKQLLPMQYGFSGNNLQAMSIISSKDITVKGNLLINNINSDYGEGAGLSIWTYNDITIDDNAFIKVNGVNTGQSLEKGSLRYDSQPNRSPEACAVRYEMDSEGDYPSYLSFMDETSDESNGGYNMVSCNVQGHEYCLGNKVNGNTMYGVYLSDDSSVCENINSKEDLVKYVESNNIDLSAKQTVSTNDNLSKSKNVKGNRNDHSMNNRNVPSHNDVDNINSNKLITSDELKKEEFKSRNLMGNVKFGFIGLMATFISIFILYGAYYWCFVKRINIDPKMINNNASSSAQYGSIRYV